MAPQPAVRLDERRIDAILAPFDSCHLPGVAAGVAIDGTPVYRKAFGLASMELPLSLTPSMRMRIGSTTKHFTAFAYLLLCEEDRAGIDDRLGQHLPELHPVTHDVTMRQLMGNISGLRDVHDICWQFGGVGRAVTSAELLALYRDLDDVNAAPGTAWIYNNGGWLLLSAVIERITGQALEDVLRERVFTPVGMHDTLLRRFDTDFVSNSASLHMVTAAGGFDKSTIGTALAGEGGMVSTVDDMLRWLAHMNEPVVGSAALWRAMQTPQVLANGTSTGYGYGLTIDRHRGVETIHHAGGVLGGNAHMLKAPGVGLDVVVLLNRHDVLGVSLANQILEACLPDLESVASVSPGPRCAGVFRSPATGRVIRLFVQGDRQMASIDGLDMPVEATSGGALRPAGIFAFLKQVLVPVGEPERPAGVRFSDFGNVDELFAVMPCREGADASAIAGRFRASCAGVEVTISARGGGALMDVASRFGSMCFELDCLAEGVWQARPAGAQFPPGGTLSFDRDDQVFRYFTTRTLGLTFRRDA